MSIDKLARVLEKIDNLNRQDPNQESVHDSFYPRELLYSRRLTAWVLELNPDASESLRIAARGQHVGRWKIPRSQYEMSRGGYLRWREDLKKHHAQTVGDVMKKAGYNGSDVERVQTIILKKNIRENPDAQIIEDALCLVFLEHQFSDLKGKTPPDKMKEIVRKTWKKMSLRAREVASKLPLTEEDKAFVQGSLSGKS